MARKALNKKNLVALGPDALADLLLEVVKGDAARQRQVRLALSADNCPQEAAAEVRKRFASIRRAQRFISWKAQRTLAKELTDLIGIIETRIAPEAPDTAFELLWALLQLTPRLQERTDDSNGTIGGIMGDAMAAIERMAPHLSVDPVVLADTVFEALLDNDYGEYDGAIPALAEALGEAGLSHLKSRAEAYQIDCAILLCLAGGWPPSVPCARARAEFIRRITPWPIEPPLQIWRCSMRAGYQNADPAQRLTRLAGLHHAPRWSVAPELEMLYSVQAVGRGADIDVSDPAFDFIRSIDVFDVRATQTGEREGCDRSETVRRGSYDVNGQFRWQQGSVRALPPAFRGDERYGENCPSINLRSVFVDWENQQGNYGFEQIDY